jgi:hypothetical protein
MKKFSIIVPFVMVVVGCNKTESSTAADGGAVAVADTAKATAPTTNTPSIVDKALSFLGAGPFEGEITMNVTEAGKPPHAITYDVKGSKMRFDAPAEAGPAGGGYVIFDGANKKMTSVSDAKKTAFVMDMNGMGGPAGMANPAIAQAAQKKPTIDKTGKTDTVAGYSCDIWKVTEDNGDKGELCVAKGITFPMMGRQASGWMSSLDDYFPLRAVMSDPSGKEKNRMEVTKIEKKSFDDSKFEVPAGYQTMNMGDMMKGLGGLRGMGGPMGGPMQRPPH